MSDTAKTTIPAILAVLAILAFILVACRLSTPQPQPPVSPLPTPTLLALQAPGDFALDGLLKMKVGKAGGAMAFVPKSGDTPPYDSMPLAEGTLAYATVNRLTGEWVELDGKIHVAWWDAAGQEWRTGWVDRDALVYR